MNIFIMAFADATRDLWAGVTHSMEMEHEVHFHDGHRLVGRLVRTCFDRDAGSGEGRTYRTSGRYCLSYDEGGTDCSFTSHAECQATASGIDGECYGPSFPDERSFRNYIQQNGEYPFQAY
jgi:hypothetical protein